MASTLLKRARALAAAVGGLAIALTALAVLTVCALFAYALLSLLTGLVWE